MNDGDKGKINELIFFFKGKYNIISSNFLKK